MRLLIVGKIADLAWKGLIGELAINVVCKIGNMRVVVTQKGLNVCELLRREGAEMRLLPSSRPASVSKALVRRAESARPRSVMKESGKVRSKHEKIITERSDLMRKIRLKLEKQRENAQIADISYSKTDLSFPSLEKDRAVYLRNLRKAQEQKYSKAWRWVESRGFASVRRSVKFSASPRDDYGL